MKAARRENIPLTFVNVMLLKRLQTWPKLGIGASLCDGSKPAFWAALCRRRISIIENTVPHFLCLSQTPVPLRMFVSFCDQTIVCSHCFSQGRQHKRCVPGALRAQPLSCCPAEQLRGCLLSIVAGPHYYHHWMPVINCQLDWLQVFIICYDWAYLEANLNQWCWETRQYHSSSSRPGP